MVRSIIIANLSTAAIFHFAASRVTLDGARLSAASGAQL